METLLKLIEHGQSYWMDDLTRGMIVSGELRRRVEQEGLRGLTSNPKIFEQAITGSSDYDAQIEALARSGDPCPRDEAVYEALALTDIRDACDILRPVYEETSGLDGYVSLEVSPHLAHFTEATIREGRRLARTVDRPNLFIKIPATLAALPAIEQLLFEGISVNITLLFSLKRYEDVAEAYLRALERRREAGQPLDTVASVASFFLSRIDVLADQLLSHRILPGGGEALPANAEALLGKVAIAKAKLAYQCCKRLTGSVRWRTFEEQGARCQRLLWASTGTKVPHYRDVMYVESLIGPGTITTMPRKTIKAFAEHGVVRDTLEEGIAEAREIMEDLEHLGIDFGQMAVQLENEGIQKFIEPYDSLIEALGERCRRCRG